MRGFGGPSRKRGRSRNRSIHETIIMHRELGTFKKSYTGTQSSILSSAWKANKRIVDKPEEPEVEPDDSTNTLSLEDSDNKNPYSKE